MEPTLEQIDAAESLSPEKQSQILRGAAAVFSEDGYEGASMSRIAARAGVSKGTLYNYFASKSDMFTAWVGLECDRSLSTVFDMNGLHGDTQADLREIGRRMLKMMISPVGLVIYRMALAEVHQFPDLARTFYATGPARAIDHMAAWLLQQVAAGQLQIQDAELAAQQFFSLCQTRVAMQRRFGLVGHPTDNDIAVVIDAAVAMFISHYGVPQ